MKGNNVRIEQENLNTARVFIDGNEVKGVTKVDYTIGVDEVPIVKLEFTPETLNFDKGKVELSITIDGQKITEKIVEQINEELQKEGNKEVII